MLIEPGRWQSSTESKPVEPEDIPIKIPGEPLRYGKQGSNPSGDEKREIRPPVRVPKTGTDAPGNRIKVGRMNRLKVVTEVDFGVYLDAGMMGEILMPGKYVPDGCQEGDEIEAFVYLDSEDRLVATTETPLAMEGELAFLEVVSTTPIGAFLDWGLPKDLLVPFKEQRDPMQQGQSYIVYIYYDNISERLVASSKIFKYIHKKSDSYRIGDQVDLIICNAFELGYRVIIDKQTVGVIYSSEIFQEVFEGQRIKGYIKTILPDGKIDVELQKTGGAARDILEEKLLKDLREANGFLPLSDRTDPEVIYKTYRVSKRAFKRAVGGLYKKRLIVIQDDGLRLL